MKIRSQRMVTGSLWIGWLQRYEKEAAHFDLWEKDVTSPELRKWFHQAPDERWK